MPYRQIVSLSAAFAVGRLFTLSRRGSWSYPFV